MSHEPESAFSCCRGVETEVIDIVKITQTKLSDFEDLLRLCGMSLHEWKLDRERYQAMSSREFLFQKFRQSTIYCPVPRRLLQTLVSLR